MLLAGSSLGVACSSDDSEPDRGAAGIAGSAGDSGQPSGGSNAGGAGTGGVRGTQGGFGGAMEAGSGDQPEPAPGDGGEGGAGVPTGFPCDVEAVIQAKCQRCHGEPPENGAPFSIVTWDDTRAEHGPQRVFEVMLPAIETDFMPLTQLELDPPVEPLTPEEKTLLLDWLGDGAPAASEGCP